MNLSSLSAPTLSSQSADLPHVSMTSSVPVAGWTSPSDSAAADDHHCLVLEQKLDPENVPQDIISQQTQLWISIIYSAGLVPLLFLVGAPCNLLSAAVFYRLGLRERINLCIFCLALVDLVFITARFFLSTERFYRLFFGSSNVFIKYLMGVSEINKVSMFLSTVIAAERCFCVVSPLRAQRVLSTRTLAFVIISVSIILWTGVVVIIGPKHTEACVFDPQTNKTSFIIYVTEYYLENKKIIDLVDIFVFSTSLPAVFVVTIVVTTIITALKLQSAVRWRQQSSSASGTQSSESLTHQMVAVTRMLIGTSVLFIVCLSPMLIVQLAMFLAPQLQRGGRYNNVVDVLMIIINFCRCVNSSFNFFIYYQMGTRFRQTLKQILACEGGGKNDKV